MGEGNIRKNIKVSGNCDKTINIMLYLECQEKNLKKIES